MGTLASPLFLFPGTREVNRFSLPHAPRQDVLSGHRCEARSQAAVD